MVDKVSLVFLWGFCIYHRRGEFVFGGQQSFPTNFLSVVVVYALLFPAIPPETLDELCFPEALQQLHEADAATLSKRLEHALAMEWLQEVDRDRGLDMKKEAGLDEIDMYMMSAWTGSLTSPLSHSGTKKGVSANRFSKNPVSPPRREKYPKICPQQCIWHSERHSRRRHSC